MSRFDGIGAIDRWQRSPQKNCTVYRRFAEKSVTQLVTHPEAGGERSDSAQIENAISAMALTTNF
jgi:hypothetical protein